MPESPLRIIPPQWKPGDRWTVAMKTPAPVPADLRPSYREHVFDFRVDAVPDALHRTYRIEAKSRSADIEATYGFYFRRDDFFVEKVTRFYGPTSIEETVIQNGAYPLIYYERRLPVIPDFLIYGPTI